MSKTRVTFQDIADHTGFTKTTISRYFNHPETVTPENREKIRRALEELGYRSNKIARILAKGETEFVGLIVPNLYLSYYAEILEQFLKTYETYGYKFIVFSGNQDAEVERRYIRELMEHNVRGLIVLSHTLPSAELAACGLPVVAVEREDRFVCSVNTDNHLGGREATRLLCRCGCEVLIHINKDEDQRHVPAYGRVTGFEEVGRESGRTHEILYYPPERDYRDLVQSIDRIIAEIGEQYPEKRKGIFCSNDEIAGLILASLLRRYGRLPEEYRLIGFDGTTVSEHAVIPISTVRQQLDQIVIAAVGLLDRLIEARRQGKPLPPEYQMIPPVLIARATTPETAGNR